MVAVGTSTDQSVWIADELEGRLVREQPPSLWHLSIHIDACKYCLCICVYFFRPVGVKVTTK